MRGVVVAHRNWGRVMDMERRWSEMAVPEMPPQGTIRASPIGEFGRAAARSAAAGGSTASDAVDMDSRIALWMYTCVERAESVRVAVDSTSAINNI